MKRAYEAVKNFDINRNPAIQKISALADAIDSKSPTLAAGARLAAVQAFINDVERPIPVGNRSSVAGDWVKRISAKAVVQTKDGQNITLTFAGTLHESEIDAWTYWEEPNRGVLPIPRGGPSGSEMQFLERIFVTEKETKNLLVEEGSSTVEDRLEILLSKFAERSPLLRTALQGQESIRGEHELTRISDHALGQGIKVRNMDAMINPNALLFYYDKKGLTEAAYFAFSNIINTLDSGVLIEDNPDLVPSTARSWFEVSGVALTPEEARRLYADFLEKYGPLHMLAYETPVELRDEYMAQRILEAKENSFVVANTRHILAILKHLSPQIVSFEPGEIELGEHRFTEVATQELWSKEGIRDQEAMIREVARREAARIKGESTGARLAVEVRGDRIVIPWGVGRNNVGLDIRFDVAGQKSRFDKLEESLLKAGFTRAGDGFYWNPRREFLVQILMQPNGVATFVLFDAAEDLSLEEVAPDAVDIQLDQMKGAPSLVIIHKETGYLREMWFREDQVMSEGPLERPYDQNANWANQLVKIGAQELSIRLKPNRKYYHLALGDALFVFEVNVQTNNLVSIMTNRIKKYSYDSLKAQAVEIDAKGRLLISVGDGKVRYTKAYAREKGNPRLGESRGDDKPIVLDPAEFTILETKAQEPTYTVRDNEKKRIDEMSQGDIDAITAVEGISLSAFEARLRPVDMEIGQLDAPFDPWFGRSTEGFISEIQSFKELLRNDNGLVRQYNLRHKNLAYTLFLMMIAEFVLPRGRFEYLGRRFEVQYAHTAIGAQFSPFPSNGRLKSGGFYIVTNLDKPEGDPLREFRFDDFAAYFAARGFYQGGHYRVDPQKVIDYFGLSQAGLGPAKTPAAGARLATENDLIRVFEFGTDMGKTILARRILTKASRRADLDPLRVVLDANNYVRELNRPETDLRQTANDVLNNFRLDPFIGSWAKSTLRDMTGSLTARERQLDLSGLPYIGKVHWSQRQSNLVANILGEIKVHELIDFRFYSERTGARLTAEAASVRFQERVGAKLVQTFIGTAQAAQTVHVQDPEALDLIAQGVLSPELPKGIVEVTPFRFFKVGNALIKASLSADRRSGNLYFYAPDEKGGLQLIATVALTEDIIKKAEAARKAVPEAKIRERIEESEALKAFIEDQKSIQFARQIYAKAGIPGERMVVLRIATSKKLRAEKMELYAGQMETLRSIVGPNVLLQFIKVGKDGKTEKYGPSDSAPDKRDQYEIIYLSELSMDALKAAQFDGAGYGPVDDLQKDGTIIPFIPEGVFLVAGARLSGVTEGLKQLFRNVRRDPLTDLDFQAHQDIKKVTVVDLIRYGKLKLKTLAELVWKQVLEFTRMVQAVGAAA
ncbi:MAG: hypothetical protein ACREH5_08400 [Candidatus Omnitrophota bacterium]